MYQCCWLPGPKIEAMIAEKLVFEEETTCSACVGLGNARMGGKSSGIEPLSAD